MDLVEGKEDEVSDEDGEDGILYLWHGYKDVSPQTFSIFKTPVVRVSVGLQHCGFVTRSGELFMYGSNSHGQLGTGTTDPGLHQPQPLHALSGKMIVDVSCGARHTVALTHDGCVYCWGDNSHGQCAAPAVCNGDTPGSGGSSSSTSPASSRGSSRASSPNKNIPKNVLLPQQVPLRDSSPPCHHGNKQDKHVLVIQIAAGEQHTLVLSEYGELWTWGSGIQLGLNNNGDLTPPTKIEFMMGRQVLSIACGARHCLALVQKLNGYSSSVSDKPKRSNSIESGKSTSTTSTGKDSLFVMSAPPRYRPATCAKCKEEVFGCDEVIEKCAIPESHKCPLGLAVNVSAADMNSKRTASSSTLASLQRLSTSRDTSLDRDSADGRLNASSSVVSLPSKFSSSSTTSSASKLKTSSSGTSLPSKVINPVSSNHTKKLVSQKNVDEGVLGSSDSLPRIPSVEDEQVEALNSELSSALELKVYDKSPNADLIDDIDAEDMGIVITTNVDSEAVAEGMVVQNEDSSLTSSQCSVKGVPKSRSIFLQDEAEAKQYLEKQFMEESSSAMGQTSGSRPGSSTTPPMSPLVKTVENFLSSYVPTQQAAAMQEYVTCVTKTVVSNIKTSVEKSIDRIGSIYSSLDEEKSEDGRGMSPSHSPTVEDIAKLEDGDFVRYGTLPKSMSMGGQRLRHRTHQRKGSLPSGAIHLDTNPGGQGPAEIVLDTEVWSWGDGRKGQLGHGDTLNRSQPCPIKMFRDAKVTKISAGAYHSLILMASSHVYVFGQQNMGKLGHTEVMSATPYCIKVAGGSPIWDVAAGVDHSVVLADCIGFCPDVHYTGKQPNSEEFITLLTRINNLRQTGLVREIHAGGSLCACISDKSTNKHVNTLHQFAASERTFHVGLDHMARKVIKPLLASESFQAVESSQMGMSMHMLCSAFLHLTDAVAVNHLELSQVIRQRREITQLRLVAKSEKNMASYQHYTKCLCDVIAMGATEYIARAASGFWEKNREQLLQAGVTLGLLSASEPPPSRLEDKALGSLLQKMLVSPLHRIMEYHKWINLLAEKPSPYTHEHNMLSQVAANWQSVKNKATLEQTSANTTREFWDTCSSKVLEALRTPKRRLLRNSKKKQLGLHAAGRFSSHSFLLFNDIFVHLQYSTVQQYHLQTIWIEPQQDSKEISNGIKLTMPEDTLLLTAPSSSDKAEWLWALNEAIGNYLNEQKHLRTRSYGGSLTPPRDRHASHIFTKTQMYKDASYSGMWRMGKMHGYGEISWSDGRRYVGRFKEGLQEGYGTFSQPKEESAEEQEGYWVQGKLHGLGTIRYAGGNVYKGYFRDGKRNGHGVLKQGKLTSSVASIYIGEWNNDKKNGYGVFDDILKGEKYMGFWQDDQRHGNGVIVTLLGMYFEGSFMQGKITGYGLLMTEDNSYYEGEFSGGPNLSGKGTLTLPNGDYIEGHFNGSFDEGIKINGTFFKASEPPAERNALNHNTAPLPKSFGRLSVPAARKWDDLFDMCCVTLGCSERNLEVNTHRAWEKVASVVAMGRKNATDESEISSLAIECKINVAIKAWERVALLITSGRETAMDESLPVNERCRASTIPDDLEKIPNFTVGKLTTEHYAEVKKYLSEALDTGFHPLGKLMEGLVDVYWATYVGVGAQPRLLHHAVQEVKSFTDRIYPIVRILFPDLPDTIHPVLIFPAQYNDEDEDDVSETVTPAALLHPLLLPKIYPPLFTLYALYNEKEDDKYWRRVCHWNKQPDLALMSYLGMKEKFWLMADIEQLTDAGQRLSAVKDKCYTDAIETLQRISTLFSPTEKMQLIHNTFTEITKVVQAAMAADYLWCMDDLLPVFQYVVVRSRIQHLGAEIHFIDDLMEEHLQFGELSIMFTTLKACYYQIQNEKIT